MLDRPIALWSAPRSVSTAFDRMMRERGDFTVLTEPFSAAYYDGPQQRSRRFAVSSPDATFERVLDDVLAAPRPLFVKEMAYQLGPLLRADVLAQFHSTFLIRDPSHSLPSLHARWPDFTPEEAGYGALRLAFDTVRALTDSVPPVLDATELQAEPASMVAAWCDAVGVEHRPEALTWEPGTPPGWDRWREWFDAAAQSSGFRPPAPPPEVTDCDLAASIDPCRRDYLALFANRLGTAADKGADGRRVSGRRDRGAPA